ncbi:MAG: hypothetical protein IJ617_10220 [Oscillospiraceae bacterium]|nr:hypothetical protein [Oscillospiraceae bacterium]
MSNREKVIEIVNAMPEYRIVGLLAFLRTFEDIPNDETVTAMEQVDEMIRTGSGQRFQGSAAEFFSMLDEEDGGVEENA